MTTAAEESAAKQRVFAGAGEMRERCRAFDWASTALGPVSTWPVSLRTAVMNMMASRHPKFLFWGPELVQIFNDAYRPSLGADDRHVVALGARGAEFWADIWYAIGGQIAQVTSGGESTWHENQLIPIFRNNRHEEVYWTYSYGPAYDDDGKIGGVLVVCQETTEQVLLNRQLEVEKSRLAYAFEQAPTFVAVLRGPQHVFEFVNAAYRQLIGNRDIIGRPLYDALPDVRGQGFDQLLDHVLASGEPYVGREVPLTLQYAPGGEPDLRYVDFVYFPIVEADGSRSGIIAHGVDITDQVRSRRDVERLLSASEHARVEADAARREADAANRAKADFLAMLSHELRTPLAAIGGYSELLLMGVHGALPAEQQQFVTRIQHSQQHLLGLIDGLLTYAQVDAGALQYDVEDVDIDEVLQSCESFIAPQFRERSLTLHYVGCHPTLHVRADREKVKQIVLNLLSNAVKFTEPGGAVTVRCNATDAGLIAVTVTDTGRGIAAADLERVFEPFVQLEAKSSRARAGTGLGLAISRQLARGMQGELTVSSEVGVGSVFTLVLPSV